MKSRLKSWIRIVLLLAGLAVFGWFVRQADPDQLIDAFTRMGWGALLMLLPYACVYAADTLGWHFSFGPGHGHGLSFGTLFRIRWMGEAVNNVVPSGYIGGEALKVYLLHKRGVPTLNSTASVVAGKTVQTLAHVVFIGAGSVAAMQLVAPDSPIRTAMAVVFAGALVTVCLLFWLQSHGIFAMLFRMLDRFRWRVDSLEARKPALLRIDGRIVDFYRNDRTHFGAATLAFLGGWFLDTMEILLLGYLMGYPIGITQALAIEAFVGVAKGMGFFVPGAVGVQETGIVFLCRMTSLPDSFGVAYAILRRGREVIYAGIGWLLLSLEESNFRRLARRVAMETKNDL